MKTAKNIKKSTIFSYKSTILSNTRTLLSYTRTALSFVAVALAFLKFQKNEFTIDVIVFFSLGGIVLICGIIQFLIIFYKAKKILYSSSKEYE